MSDVIWLFDDLTRGDWLSHSLKWPWLDILGLDLTLSHFLPPLSMAYGISVAEISPTYVYALVPHIEFMD